jgi:hypothetical protein
MEFGTVYITEFAGLEQYTVTFHTPYMYGNVNENKNRIGSVIQNRYFQGIISSMPQSLF